MDTIYILTRTNRPPARRAYSSERTIKYLPPRHEDTKDFILLFFRSQVSGVRVEKLEELKPET
jgi:hypothetical protein